MGTHLRVLSKSYPMNTIMTGFRWFSRGFASFCFGQAASALGGLKVMKYISDTFAKIICFYSVNFEIPEGDLLIDF